MMSTDLPFYSSRVQKESLEREHIRRVAVILAPSRSGSSFLFHALRSRAPFLSLQGEETPHYKAAGLGMYNHPHYSDQLKEPPPHHQLNTIANSLLQEMGILTPNNFSMNDYRDICLRRFALQWPELNSEAEWSVIKNVLEQKLKVQAPHPTQSAHWENFYLEWLQELVTRGIPIQLDLYSTTSSHPKDLALKEDPPYIAAVPMLPINKERADQHPLLFKTSSNIYRIPLLKALFPRAHFSWIILQRNPAASINALMDGWLSTAFHSQEVYPDFELKIKGYSDNIPQGSRYWKFDMPPGWQNYIHASLEEVCAFQWYSAAQTIEDFISQLDEPFIRIKYEDLFSASDPIHSGLERNLKQIFDFTQLVPYSHSLWNPKTPVVAVKDPSPGKWKKRQEIILPLIETFSGGKLLHLAHRLDYDTNKILEWP